MTLLSIKGLSKAYPGVVANDNISFDVAPGEIHALLGENGAGKSTLVKMIYGLVKPDHGAMVLHDAPFSPAEPRAARASGVAMVFQHFSLFDALTVAENVGLGMEAPPRPRQLSRRIAEVSRAYGLPLDPGRRVGDLSVGERQRVEIIRCLLQDPKLLIMDEPTSVLTPQEVETLFATLRRISAEGTAILYISHKLEEIRTLCQAATILRRGQVVARMDPRTATARELAERMVGTRLTTPKRSMSTPGEALLDISGLSLPPASAFGTPLRDVSMTVRSGEVLGIGGVAGNGQDELLSAIAGERRSRQGTVRLRGRDLSRLDPTQRRAAGLLTAPEERLGHAAAPDMSLTENTLLSAWQSKELTTLGFVNWAEARGFARDVIAQFDVRTPGARVAARSLSGGNLQKFVIGREVMQEPDVLVVNQPTWGVDAAAAAAIRQALLDLAGVGAGVVVISQDLDELLEISDRFAALNAGRLSAPVPAADLTMETIGLMLGGESAGAVA